MSPPPTAIRRDHRPLPPRSSTRRGLCQEDVSSCSMRGGGAHAKEGTEGQGEKGTRMRPGVEDASASRDGGRIT